MLGQNQTGQWQYDPALVRRRAILGITIGGLCMLLVITFVLLYFLVLKPPQKDEEGNPVFQCSK